MPNLTERDIIIMSRCRESYWKNYKLFNLQIKYFKFDNILKIIVIITKVTNKLSKTIRIIAFMSCIFLVQNVHFKLHFHNPVTLACN